MRSILDAMTHAEKHEYLDHSSPQRKKGSWHLTPELLGIKERLMPLVDVEKTLIRRLTTAGSGEVEATHREAAPDHLAASKPGLKEIAINSAIPWKNAFNRLIKTEERASFDSAEGIDWDDPEDPSAILNSCSQDMIQLWNNPNIKQLLVKQNARVQDYSGLWVFFFSLFLILQTLVFWTRWTESRLVATSQQMVREVFHEDGLTPSLLDILIIIR